MVNWSCTVYQFYARYFNFFFFWKPTVFIQFRIPKWYVWNISYYVYILGFFSLFGEVQKFEKQREKNLKGTLFIVPYVFETLSFIYFSILWQMINNHLSAVKDFIVYVSATKDTITKRLWILIMLTGYFFLKAIWRKVLFIFMFQKVILQLTKKLLVFFFYFEHL